MLGAPIRDVVEPSGDARAYGVYVNENASDLQISEIVFEIMQQAIFIDDRIPDDAVRATQRCTG